VHNKEAHNDSHKEDVEIDIVPNIALLTLEVEAKCEADYRKFHASHPLLNTQPSMGTLLEYIELKNSVRKLKEAAARQKMQHAMLYGTPGQQIFEFTQAARDFGWLYYYILKYHIEILKTRVNSTEILAKVDYVHLQLFVPYEKELLKHQTGR
jgi:hypothetical protein